MRLAICCSLFFVLFTVPLAAIQVEVIPAVPLEGEPFKVRVSGVWRDSCAPENATVFVSGPHIIPTFTLGGGGCFSAVMPFEAEVEIPRRPRGEYDVSVRVIDFGGTVKPLGEVKVTVAPSAVEPLEAVAPDFGGEVGGTLIRIFGPFGCSGECPQPRVWLGDLEATGARVEHGLILVHTPLQAAGVVDVIVRRGDQEWRRPGGFRYLRRGEFERILVPVWFAGTVPGANGSRWQSSFRLFNGHGVPLIQNVDLLPIDQSCEFLCPGEPPIAPGSEIAPRLTRSWQNSVPAAMLYVHRTLASQIGYQARIRDQSRQSSTWGTEVPVVRNSTPRPGPVRLLDVPFEDDFRVMLRIYGLEPETGGARVRVFDAASGDLLLEENVVLSFPQGSVIPWIRYHSQPRYTELPDLQLRPELATADRVRIEISGSAWGMVSVTHNESQHVTLLSPQ
jgi:hypothetical protein